MIGLFKRQRKIVIGILPVTESAYNSHALATFIDENKTACWFVWKREKKNIFVTKGKDIIKQAPT